MATLNFRGGKRLPLVLQAERSECALCCLAMILTWFGREEGMQALRRKCPVPARGANLKTVLGFTETLSLDVRPLRLEMDELKRLQTPAILHWDLDHFVVLKKLTAGRLHIHDPAVGRVTMDKKTAGKHFSGVALELTPNEGFIVAGRDGGQVGERNGERDSDSAGASAGRFRFRDLWGNVSGLPKHLLQLFLLSLLLQVFSLAMPFYSQLFIDDVLVNQDLDLLTILATGFFLVMIIKCCTEALRSFVILYLGNMLGFHVASRVCRHLLRLPLAYFSRRHVGDIVSRFASLHKLKDFLCSGVIAVVIDGLMVIVTLAVMFAYSGLLTWVALGGVALYVLFRASLYHAFYARNQEVLHTLALENSHFIENLQAMQGLKAFGREHDRLRTWQNRFVEVINAGVRLERLNIGARLIHGLLLGTENIVLILLSGHAVIGNQLSIGMVIAYLSFKDQFYNRVFTLLDSLFEFKLLDVHLERLGDITGEAAEKGLEWPGSGVQTFDPASPCLVLDKLAFRYSRSEDFVFQDVDLVLENHESIAIIGPSGCGKSSLLKVAMSLLQAESGSLRLHGRAISEIGLAAYRRMIAGVLQDDRLLAGSILDNITFFDPHPDMGRVRDCATAAAIDEEISRLPMQYNTLTGSMAASFSAGQIQRILLARALYRQPRLLVLDEASSNLDPATETRVNDALRTMKVPRLIVAHRPRTIQLADRVFLLQRDGLRETGPTAVAHGS